MKISIVTPFFNESESIQFYFERLVSVLESLGHAYEIVCVDDGSEDGTFEILVSYKVRFPHLKCIKFSRNFGKEAALTCGLHHATGDVVIPMDCDLQDPPELLGSMIEEWKKGFMVVNAKRSDRDEGLMKSVSARFFYKLINKLSDSHIPENVGDFRLMDKRVVEAVNQLKEKTRFMKGILSWPGFKTTTITYSRPSRMHGKPKQNYLKLFALAFDGIVSFSDMPLKVIVGTGFAITFFSFLYLIFIVLRPFFMEIDVAGYSSTIAIILFLGGMNMLSIGVVGIFISKIFNESKNRPIYVVETEVI